MLQALVAQALKGMGKIDESLSKYFTESQKELDEGEFFALTILDIEGKMQIVPVSINKITKVATQLNFKEDEIEIKSIPLTDFLAKQITGK